MSFATPIGLLALLALPAIVVLHLFRQRRRERRVAGLFLFLDEARIVTAGRKPRPLERTLSLLLELLAALCLALALGGLALDAQEPAHLVLVLDDAASLQAVAFGESAAVRARRAAEEVLDEVGARAQVSVIAAGERPVVLLGPRAPAALLADALERWSPRAAACALAPAWALAGELAGEAGRVVFISDRIPSTHPPEAEVRAVGRGAPNVAIAMAWRDAAEGSGVGGEGASGGADEGSGERQERIGVDLVGYGGARSATLSVHEGEGPAAPLVDRRAVALERGGPTHVSFALPARLAASAVHLRLDPDALAADDEALLLPEPARTVRYRVDLPAERASALRIPRALEAAGAIPGAAGAADTGRADLVVRARDPAAPAAAPAAAAGPGAVRVELELASADAPAHAGPFLIDRAHPLTSGVALLGTSWRARAPLGLLPGRPLVEVADGGLWSVEERADDTLLVHLCIAMPGALPDLAANDLLVTASWPILWANLVEAARERLPGARRVNVRIGDRLVYRPRLGEGGPFTLLAPDGAVRAGPDEGARVLLWIADQPGVYELRGGSGAVVQRFAAAFAGPSASDLGACETRTVPAEPRAAAALAGPDGAPLRAPTEPAPLTSALALAALALCLADWWWLGRGRAAAATAAAAAAKATSAYAPPGAGGSP